MIDGKKASFRNIIVQDNEGNLQTIEPGEGQHVTLFTFDENTKIGTSLAVVRGHIAVATICRFIAENPPLRVPLILELLASAVKEREAGGLPPTPEPPKKNRILDFFKKGDDR